MKKNINIVVMIMGFLLLLAIGIVYTKVMEQSTSRAKITVPVEHEFTLNALNGSVFKVKASEKKLHIKGMENKIVFLKVFGWDCNFCMKEVPELIKLKRSIPEEFDVIAIEAQEHSADESKKFIEKYGINYPIVLGKNQEDFYRYLQQQYGWTGIIPLTIVISKKGDILAFELGSKSYSLSELFKASLEKSK